MSTFIAELRRRNVVQMSIAYIAAGWLLVSIGDVALPLLGAPDWVFKALIAVIALGLPIVLVVSWFFELTPEGLKREKDVDREESITAATGRKLNVIAIAVLLAALTVSVYLNVSGTPGSATATAAHGSVAVLPFLNQSSEPGNEIFVDGIHDDILTTLAHNGELKVITRTSVMPYRDSDKRLGEIARELGVATVVQGRVQRIGDDVRINVALVDAATEDHLWADTFDRALSARNIFEVQSEIARRISAALQTTLSPNMVERTDTVPTESLEAYQLYQRGRDNLHDRLFETTQLARAQFEEAATIDPEYADAWVGLADSALLLKINHNLITAEEAYLIAQDALDKALDIDPQNADAYASLGLLKLDMWEQTRSGPEIDEAEKAFERAIELNPNNAQAVMWYASLRATRFDMEEAIALYNRSLELDPLGRIPYANLPGMYASMGRNQEALDKWLEAVRLHPGWPTPFVNIAVHLQKLGRVDEAIAWFVKASDLDTDPLSDGNVLGAWIALGEYDRISEFMDRLPDNHPLTPVAPMFVNYLGGNFQATIEIAESLLREGNTLPGFALDLASDAAIVIGDLDTAERLALMQSPALADDPIANVDAVNAPNAVKLGYIAARRGDEATAQEILSAALAAIADRPRLGMAGHGILDVEIKAILGQGEEALALLREAVDAGFRTTLQYDNWPLSMDPYLETLRADPRFQAIEGELQGYLDQMHVRALNAEANDEWDGLRTLAVVNPINPAATL